MTNNPALSPATKGPPFRRDPQAVMSLPLPLFWEVTRRHAYYLAFWDLARAEGSAINDEIRDYARQLLLLINVTAEPVDPAASADEIGATQLATGFLRGGVIPLTYRAMLRLMMITLPQQTRQAIGQVLCDSAGTEESTPQGLWKLMQEVETDKLSALDILVSGLHVTINPYASVRTITEATTSLVGELKSQIGATETRRRHDEIPGYLRVWDLREGWTGTGYDGARERTFKEISQAEGVELSTVVSRYRSAFKLITGHCYSPEIWLCLFGVLKISRHFNDGPIPRRSLRRPMASRSKASLPDEQPAIDSIAAVEIDFEEFTDQCVRELVRDIKVQIERGRSTEDIQDELNIRDGKLVDYLRSRVDDLP